MNRFRFYITALSSRVEVFPLNHWKTSLIDERENGKIYYRRKFNGTLQFTDNNGGDDFSLFYLIEVNSPCERLIFEIEEKDSGANTYHNYWTGHFSTTDGVFDLDKCTFTVTPKTYDNYLNFDDYGDEKYNILSIATPVTTNAGTYSYTRNRWLTDVIEYLLAQIEPAAILVSWFLQNETNPVIAGTNKYRYLTIAQKSDIKRPTSSNPATIGMMSFNELMDILRMYNLFWTYDGDILRIEHYDYWESTDGLDLRTQSISQGQCKYSYVKDDMPKYEKFIFAEAGDANYTEHTISYDSPCVDPNLTSEYRNTVTTDLSYIQTCMADPDLISNISDDGWVILANYESGGNYYVYLGITYDSPLATYNYPNSWAYLLRAFFFHGRVLLNGYIQFTAYEFISTIKTKQQEIKAIVCYEDDYDPADLITTELGETWLGGQKGQVNQATISPTGQVDFILRYGEARNSEGEMPEQDKTIQCVVSVIGGNNTVTVYFSEPPLIDIIFWIFYNNSTCQEISISAGTMYHQELADETDPLTSVEFNLDDMSLTGWTFVYNDNEEVVLVDPGDGCPAVPPPPPAVPPATTMIGCGQAIVCDKITINWNSSPGATFYKLFRKPDDDLIDQWQEVDNVIATTYDDYWAGTQGGVTFYYKVKACNASGCSADSDEASIIATC